MSSLLRQIEDQARRKSASKLPTWSTHPDLQLPTSLSLEQCSSEITAMWKAALVQGTTHTDLTGGLGIDCYFMHQRFQQSTYVEINPVLVQAARHNFAQLHAPIQVIEADSTAYLQDMEPVDCLFLDPARRDSTGKRTYGLADCTPDVTQLKPLLLAKCHTLLLKLSPMLDIAEALRAFPECHEVHVWAVQGECKELVLAIRPHAEGPVTIHTRNNDQHYQFTLQEEASATLTYSTPKHYLYEPHAALMKAGGFRSLCSRFPVHALHPNSHLYTSDTYLPDFPGRAFAVERITSANKAEMTYLTAANISVRNYPARPEDLRKKWRLKDGGDTYLIATTLCDGQKAILHCSKPTKE